ncbi:hypothetical protein DICPUDRAFT_149441 [Dictyostelium purpureum]|uniref:RING-type domain-containing protein n=1 Tax=Dictyostelium purpureum TaxID=5786 RepID=F0ZDR3_DICPU|nr:uncharacterized protein DICPUDRAFT_149441 [Dictyostelium purpureum]EGC37911.1 hypothetical protein DICPUDRAFT_149441 [Dictyostelium purpureum]|eukprot:XP_003285571.1 hypothetical protein DICPUDRAFT_149441 [Dictyostelium purpureum]
MKSIIYEDLLVDKSSVHQELFCIICSNLIKDARQCSESHIFCDSCIKEWLKTQTTCPSCRNFIFYDNLAKNRLVNNLIGNLKIHCPDGCCETITIDELESHLKCCEKRYVKCPQGNCGNIRLSSLDEHLNNCRYNYINNCLYRNGNQERQIIQEIKEERKKIKELQMCNQSEFKESEFFDLSKENTYHYDVFNKDYLNYLQNKVNEIQIVDSEHIQNKKQEIACNQIVGSVQDDNVNHALDWIIQNYNEKIRNMGENGYFEIIPFEHIILRFYPLRTEYFTTPCKPGVTPMEIWQIQIISKCLIPIDFNLTIQSPISREVKSILRENVSLDIKFDRVAVKNDLKLSFIINYKKKYLSLFTS